MKDADGWEPAEPSISLLDALRGLVEDYLKDASIFKEFIQNADDACASGVHFRLDLRASDNDSPLLGPALVVHNDAVFSESDFEDIIRIGTSEKALTADKIGRFGRGFNVCYNVTDFPGWVSADRVTYFDPHRRIFGRDGVKMALADAWRTSPELLATFVGFGFDANDTEYEGTIFRLPLRTEESAADSAILAESFTRADFESILDELRDIGSSLLLFLKHVLSIEVDLIDADGTHACLLRMSTQNVDEVRAGRNGVANASQARSLADTVESTYEHVVDIALPGEVRCDRYLVVQGVYVGPDGVLAAEALHLSNQGSRAIPWAGAAALLDRETAGRVFCFLPLPERTALPFHVHGYFDLDNKRAQLTERGTGEKLETRKRWNSLLLRHAVAPAASALISDLTSRSRESPYSHWPDVSAQPPGPLETLVESIYRELTPRAVIWTANDSLSEPGEIRIVPASIQAPMEADELDGMPKPALPSCVSRGFEAAGLELAEFAPADLRDEIRLNQQISSLLTEMHRPSLRRRDWLKCLLSFAIQDEEPAELKGVPLALTSQGTVRAFAEAQPLYLASERVRSIFADHPEWFLDSELADATGVEACEQIGLFEMDLSEFLERIGEVLQSQQERPSDEWIEDVLSYLFDQPDLPAPDELGALRLIPDRSGVLHGLGASAPMCPRDKPNRRLLEQCERLGLLIAGGADDLRTLLAEISGRHPEYIPPFSGETLLERIVAVEPSEVLPPELLSYLSSPSAVEELSSCQELLRRLAALRVLEAESGHAVAASASNVFIASGFQSPDLPGKYELLPDRFRRLFRLMNVERLDASNYVEKVLLTTYLDADPTQQLAALSWLRYQFEVCVSKAASPEDFERLVRDASLVRCTDGSVRPAPQTYDPEVDLIREVLGDRAPTPDRRTYGREWQRWMPFFRRLGMANTPRAQDVVDYIDELCDHANDGERDVAHVTDAIKKVFRHLDAHWEGLHDGIVHDEEYEQPEVPLARALRDRDWVPPIQDSRLSRYAAAATPEPRLYSPSEVFFPGVGHRVASQAALADLHQPKGTVAESLGFRQAPPLELVLEHFDAVLRAWDAGSVELPVFERSLTQIYTAIGQHQDEDNSLSDRYAGRACLWCRISKRLYEPAHAFEQARYLQPWRVELRGKGDIDVAFSMLGRREAPELTDLLALLRQLHDESVQLDTDAHGRLRTVVFEIERLCDEESLDTDDLYLLARSGEILHSSEVYVDDTDWLEDLLVEREVPIADLRWDSPLVEKAELPHVSLMLEPQPCAEWSFVRDERYRHYERFVHSPEFANAVNRILHHHGRQPTETHWIQHLSVQGVADVRIRWILRDFGELGERQEEAFLDQREQVLYLRAGAPDEALTVVQWIARTLAVPQEWLHLLGFGMDRDPRELDALLTRAGIRPLPTDGPVRAPADYEEEPPAWAEPEEEETKHDEAAALESTAESTESDDVETDVVREGLHGEPDASEEKNHEENGISARTHESDSREATAPPVRPGPPETEGEPDAEGLAGLQKPSSTRSSRHATSKSGGPSTPPAPGKSDKKPPLKLDEKPQDRIVSYVAGPGELDKSGLHREQDSKATGRAAERYVRERQRRNGWTVDEKDHHGFDIIATRGDETRYIEVKGVQGPWGKRGVGVTRRQFEAAREYQDQYWLYVVEYALDRDRRHLWRIHNPADKITRYYFDDGWKGLARSLGLALKDMRPGLRIAYPSFGVGIVKEVHGHGTLGRLKVQFGKMVVEVPFRPHGIKILETPDGSADT